MVTKYLFVCRWLNVLSRLVLAQLPDETQRLSSQSNSSASSGGSDMNPSHSTTSDKLSQADSGCVAESLCGDQDSPLHDEEDVQ